MTYEQKIIFAGGGGHALSLLEALSSEEAAAGYLAPTPAAAMNIRYLGEDGDAERFISEGRLFHIAFVYAGLPLMDKRRSLIALYENLGAKFATIVAPTAIVSRHSSLGTGVAVLNGAIVNRAHVGNHSIINSGAIIEHDCRIGSNTFIGPGAVVGGGTVIGDNCFIGLGAKIKNGITIGNGVTVAMGATVTRDLPDSGIYHGSPLKKFNLTR